MDEQEIQEFSLEDIIREFSDTPAEPVVPEEEPLDAVAEEISAVTDDTVPFEPQTVSEEVIVAETPSVSGDTVRIAPVVTTGDTIVMEPVVTGDTIVMEPIVTGDTVRMDAVVTDAPASEEPVVVPPEEPEQEAFTGDWEPQYEDPIGEYVPPRPILVHPRSRLRELKKKLVAGPEKQYYALMEKGFGKLQAAIFFCVLVVLLSAGATVMYALDVVPENRMRLMVFGQFMAMLISALLGSGQMVEGLADLYRKRFSLNTLLVFSFVLCCVDGVLCFETLRVPCCAAFSLQVLFSLWSVYQKRSARMGQLDTMRKANHLDGLTTVADYYEGMDGIVQKEAQVEDFTHNYRKPGRYDKIQSIYAIVVVFASLVSGGAGGVLRTMSQGIHSGITFGIQVAAVTTLAALPASMFVCLSRPMAILERRLHKLGAVLCGWSGVKALSKKAVFPLGHEDICPTGSVKLNGVKFFGDRESDEIIAYCTAMCSASGGALKTLFEHLLDSRNGIHYEVVEFCAYENGGVGGEINAEPVLVGSLSFLKEMGVEIPSDIKIPHCVGISIDGEFCGLFAIVYEKNRAAAAGLATLTGYRKLKVVLTTGDFMLTNEFLKKKFGINTKKVIQPDPETRTTLRAVKPEEDAPVAAISTAEGLAPFAYCVTGAKALRSAAILGTVIHLIGGCLGIAMMLVLAVLGAEAYLTPANLFLYQLVWMVPGVLITNWTRPL